jgi:addiction module HigA family antidote
MLPTLTHPGQLLKDHYLLELGLTTDHAASLLGVSASTVSRFVNGKSDLSYDMAIRLAVCFGTSESMWITLQNAYSLDKARQGIDLSTITPIQYTTEEDIVATIDAAHQRIDDGTAVFTPHQEVNRIADEHIKTLLEKTKQTEPVKVNNTSRTKI